MNNILHMSHAHGGHQYLHNITRLCAVTLFKGVVKGRYILAFVIFVAVLCSPTLSPLATSPVAVAVPEPKATVVTRTDAETYYVQAVNQLRTELKLPALIIDTRLTTSASQKTADMISQNYWAHFAPNGTSFADYIWASSPSAYKVGENLARCFATREEAFASLIASPAHYEIMTSDFTYFGVAESTDSATGCTYTTMHFSLYK